MGVAITVDANLPIAAGAIIGGAFFGDKMSPLSDTTNVAALAAEVPLFEHIGSMMYTTVPSALITAVIYFFSDLFTRLRRPQNQWCKRLLSWKGLSPCLTLMSCYSYRSQ